MSKKRKRSALSPSERFEKVIKDAVEKDLSDEENKAMRVAIRDYLTTEPGGAECLYKLLMKVVSSSRCAEGKKIRALHVMDFVFLKSKEFRGVASREMRGIIRTCCEGVETNAAAINSNALAVKLFSFLHNWDTSFGVFYPELRAVARYYRESVRVLDSTGLVSRAAEQDQEDRSRRLLYATCRKVLDGLDDQLCAVEANLTTAFEIFEILFPSFHVAPMKESGISTVSAEGQQEGVDSSVDTIPVDDGIEWEDGGVESDIKVAPAGESFASMLSAAGLMSVDYSLEITIGISVSDIQTVDNEILVNQLREVTTVFRKHTVPKLAHIEALFQHTINDIKSRNVDEKSQDLLQSSLLPSMEMVASAKKRVTGFLDKANVFFNA